MMRTIKILVGDNRKTLKSLPDSSVHTVVTSPPYWNLRNYNDEKLQIGQEKTVTDYIKSLVKVFRQVKRVLRDDGTVWLNLGDSYAKKPDTAINVKKTDLIGVPWRVALALQEDGWFVRADIIWHKQSGLPESAKNRPSRSHEYVFLLTKSEKYYYDVESSKVPSLSAASSGTDLLIKVRQRSVWTINASKSRLNHTAMFPENLVEACLKGSLSAKGVCAKCKTPLARYKVGTEKINDPALSRFFGGDSQGKYSGKNLKSVDRQKSQNPSKSKQRMLDSMLTKTKWKWKAVCNCKADIALSTVLDPFGGSGTTGIVASRFKANTVLCELNIDYAKIAKKRIKDSGVAKLLIA